MTKPIVFITIGLPASGKTYFTDRLADDLKIFHINTDRLRLSMIEKPTFSPEENDRVYREMVRLAHEKLEQGVSLICNGNYDQRDRRKIMREMAENAHAVCVALFVETPIEVVRERIQTRDHEIPVEKMVHQPLELLGRRQEAFEAPTTEELVIRIDGTRSYEAQLDSFKKQSRQLEL